MRGGYFEDCRDKSPYQVCQLLLECRCGLRALRIRDYCSIKILTRSTTSGGCTMTCLANASSSSPLVGVISKFFLLASAKSSGSFMTFKNASRRIFTRSGAIPGGATIGRPKSLAAKHQRDHAPIGLRSFVLIHELLKRGYGRQARISRRAGLHQDAREVGFAPCVVRFARMIRLNGEGAAMQLAALHGEIDLAAALVTGDDSKLGAESFFQHPRHVAARSARSRRAAFRRFFGLTNVG